MHRSLAGAAALLFAIACSSNKDRPPSSLPRDASASAEDAEAHEPDATEPADTGTGAPDAGSDADAAIADAAPTDGGDMCMDGPRKPPRARARVVNGTRTPTILPLDAEQIMAVVGIASLTDGAWCSGTLIAERIVLTATHCTVDEDASAMRVLFGEDDLAPDLAVPVIDKLEHPTRDVALLTLAFDPATMIGVRPIPIYLGTLSAMDEGITVEQAGYGDTESTTHGRFFVTELLASVGSRTFTVDGMGIQGVCYGDSGGPSMMVAPEGDVRVLGDLSEGDTECAHRDDYVRVDVIRPWIEAVTGPTPSAGPIACGPVTAEGECRESGAAAAWCENNELTLATCTAGELCGWSGFGWRCMAASMDPCEGLAYYGTCEGQVARWCDAGVIYERDCAKCGEACLYLGERIGSDCDVDPLNCGELDYLGRCDGNVSEWCNEDNRRERLDCAATGQICRYIDTELGYYCADP